LEIYRILYMKKVTEFREIPRNFTELYDTKFGGIPPELQPIPHGIRNRRKEKKQTEFRVGEIPWTPYSVCADSVFLKQCK
jgi:hypothetical protein